MHRMFLPRQYKSESLFRPDHPLPRHQFERFCYLCKSVSHYIERLLHHAPLSTAAHCLHFLLLPAVNLLWLLLALHSLLWCNPRVSKCVRPDFPRICHFAPDHIVPPQGYLPFQYKYQKGFHMVLLQFPLQYELSLLLPESDQTTCIRPHTCRQSSSRQKQQFRPCCESDWSLADLP